jgi:hypothetical protein
MRLHSTLFALTLTLTLGCGGKGGGANTPDESETTAIDTGPAEDTTFRGGLHLKFQMDPDLIASMDTPAVGWFYGGVYSSEDVDADGPLAGATVVEEITVELDMGDGSEPTGIAYSAIDIALPSVVISGFLDVNDNAESTALGPDDGDPVTSPHLDNTFTITPNQTALVTVALGELYPEP